MGRTLELEAVGSPEARAALEQMLRALQGALRLAMAKQEQAAEEAAFWTAMDEALAAYDHYLGLVAAAHPMACRLGCTACCHDNPQGVAGVEILRIQRRLARDGLVPALENRITAAADAFHSRVESLGAKTAAESQRARGEPCPLLGSDGACAVYPERPVACRMFHANTPAAWCSPGHPRFGDRVNPNLVPPAVCLQILGAISRCLGLPASTDLWGGLVTLLRSRRESPLSPGAA